MLTDTELLEEAKRVPEFLEVLRAARLADLIPFYVVVPVSREAALDAAVPVDEFVERHARDELKHALERFRDQAGR
jgi:hypothetical protein